MTRVAILILLLTALAGAAGADDNAAFIAGPGIHAPGERTNPCSVGGETPVQNHDGTTENAFTWQMGGVVAPDYGAFAEGYTASQLEYGGNGVCGIQIYFTRWGTMTGTGTIDLYVWDYDAGSDNPGAVLSSTPSVAISGIAMWPTITTKDLACNFAPAYNGAFVGYWPRSFEGVLANFGCAMDQNGVGGVPRTNIVPGIGYPTGWNSPSVAGYAIQAFGIGAWTGYGIIGGGEDPPPESIEDGDLGRTEVTSWGQIKLLNR